MSATNGIVLGLQVIDAFLAVTEMVESHNINARKLLALREQSKADGRRLTMADFQPLLDDLEDSIDAIPVLEEDQAVDHHAV